MFLCIFPSLSCYVFLLHDVGSFLFFAWRVIVALGVATCVPMIISNNARCLHFPNFQWALSSFFEFCFVLFFAFVVLRCWIFFFFAWCTIVQLGVVACALLIISDIVYCPFFCNFLGILSSFFELCFASHLLLHHDVDSVLFFSQLAHCFCIGVVTSTLVIITNSACYWLLSNFQHTPSSFFQFCFCYITMQAFSIFLVGELLTLINVVLHHSLHLHLL